MQQHDKDQDKSKHKLAKHHDDVMLFLAECIRIFTTWQAIPFKRKFYFNFYIV